MPEQHTIYRLVAKVAANHNRVAATVVPPDDIFEGLVGLIDGHPDEDLGLLLTDAAEFFEDFSRLAKSHRVDDILRSLTGFKDDEDDELGSVLDDAIVALNAFKGAVGK